MGTVWEHSEVIFSYFPTPFLISAAALTVLHYTLLSPMRAEPSGQSGVGAGFLRVLRFPRPKPLIPPTSPSSSQFKNIREK
jgi:hypothetical protein